MIELPDRFHARAVHPLKRSHDQEVERPLKDFELFSLAVSAMNGCGLFAPSAWLDPLVKQPPGGRDSESGPLPSPAELLAERGQRPPGRA